MSLFTKQHGHSGSPAGHLANGAVILFADLQEGISDLTLTVGQEHLRRSVRALAQLAKIFSMPVIVSTVPGRDGGPAKVMPVIGEILGHLTHYQRTTPACFANEVIAAAVAATGRKTVIVSGVATEVAVQLACLSALEHGYRAQIAVDACGGISPQGPRTRRSAV